MEANLKAILDGLSLSLSDIATLQNRWSEEGFSTRKLARAVDESPFPLKDWIAAWLLVEEYLSTQSKRTDAVTILGYLQCCADAVRNSVPSPDFSEEVSRMLQQFGMERTQP